MNISIISFLIALIVISLLIAVLLRQKAQPARQEYRPRTKEDDTSSNNNFNPSLVKSKWVEIQTMQNSGPSGLKAALVDADKLLDYCMIGKGFAGETMGDRLKSGGDRFSNLNSVWSAHKLRNQLAHEVEHDIVASEVKQAIANLGSAIRELGVSI